MRYYETKQRMKSEVKLKFIVFCRDKSKANDVEAKKNCEIKKNYFCKAQKSNGLNPKG